MTNACKTTRFTPGRISGSAPAKAEDYVLIMFDISNPKKYRILIKLLKKYGKRVQKSVFEAQLNRSQISELEKTVGRLMSSDRFYNESDSVRIYRIAGNCNALVYGSYTSVIMEENVVL